MSLNPNLHSQNVSSKVRSLNVRFYDLQYLVHSRLTQMGFWRAAPADTYAGWVASTATEDTAGDGFDHAKGLVAANRRGAVEDKSTNANDDTWHYQNMPWIYLGDRGVAVEFGIWMYLSDADGSAIFAGIGIPSDYTASLLDGTAYGIDAVGFIKETGDANLDFVSDKTNADTTYAKRDNAITTLADAEWNYLAFRVIHSQLTSGTFQLEAYINGTRLSLPNCGALTSNVPNAQNLGLMLAHRGGAADLVYWSDIDVNVWEPGEYVG